MTPPPPPQPGTPRLQCDVTKRVRLVAATPAHVARDRWMASIQLDGVGTWIHHGTADQAEQIADWLTGRHVSPLAVGSLSRLDSRLTLDPITADTVLVRVEYVIANGTVSTGRLTLPRDLADRWRLWLCQWLTAHPTPVGQLALFTDLSAAAAA